MITIKLECGKMSEEPSISLDDFMDLDEAAPSTQKKLGDDAYLAELSTKQARNPAYVANKLGVTPATVVRRLSKDPLSEKIITRYKEKEPLYVRKPDKDKEKAKTAKKSKKAKIEL